MIMKKISLLLAAVALFLGFALVSCDQDNPEEADLFTGMYKGAVSFTHNGDIKKADNGTVTVSKIGDSYSFIFSDGIPAITNIKIAKGENNSFQLGTGATGFIRITGDKLNIFYTVKDKGIWTADCDRK